MPCTSAAENQTARRKREMAEAIDRLKRSLAAGTVKVVISRSGAVAFKGLWRSDGVADVCAYRALQAANSIELRQAVARAETLAGVKVSPQQVAAGTHSHDGGTSWHAGH